MADHEAQVRKATELHERIADKLAAIRRSKIDVYFLLREMHRSGLYRHIPVPVAPAHARKICAERRFTTWEDYLSNLASAGISFGYFAELERLSSRLGDAFVRLCADGIPVRTRRLFLRAPLRIAREIRSVAESGASDDEKRATIEEFAGYWREELDARKCNREDDLKTVGRYRRHMRDWERKLEDVAQSFASATTWTRGTRLAEALVSAWRDVFDAHLLTGQRLAELSMSARLARAHREFLWTVSQAWGTNRLEDAAKLVAMPPDIWKREQRERSRERRDRAFRAREPEPLRNKPARAVPVVGPRTRIFV
jgi:hypothetical protein